MFRGLWKISAFALVCAVAAPVAAEESEPQAIYGGGKVKPCGWPTTVSMNGCTGTLVHPEVVVFAAHCMSGSYGPSSVTFGDNENSPAFKVGTQFCKANPKYNGGALGQDHAFCKLKQAVTSVPIVPILMGCETQALAPGAQVVAVGFGQANDGLGWGPKREVTMKLNSVKNGEAFIGGGGKDTCYGDSGGPVYIRMSDNTWRVFGITSYGEYCGGGGYYSMMHTAIDWIESQSGVDLTPCHQGGQWAPTAGCGKFPMDPELGGGSWSSGCATGNVSGYSATCGAGYDGSTGSGGSSGGGGATGGSGGGTAGGGSGGGSTGGSGGWSGGGSGGSGGWSGGGSGGWAGGGSGGWGSGSSGSGAEGGGPPVGTPGCSGGNDCDACGTCIDKCVCLTNNPTACQTACAPIDPPSGGASGVGGWGGFAAAGGNSTQPDPSGTPRDDVTGGCACRATPSSPRSLGAAWLLGVGLLFLRLRRRIRNGARTEHET